MPLPILPLKAIRLHHPSTHHPHQWAAHTPAHQISTHTRMPPLPPLTPLTPIRQPTRKVSKPMAAVMAILPCAAARREGSHRDSRVSVSRKTASWPATRASSCAASCAEWERCACVLCVCVCMRVCVRAHVQDQVCIKGYICGRKGAAAAIHELMRAWAGRPRSGAQHHCSAQGHVVAKARTPRPYATMPQPAAWSLVTARPAAGGQAWGWTGQRPGTPQRGRCAGARALLPVFAAQGGLAGVWVSTL